MIDTQSSALAHRSLWRRRVAVQFWGCLAPSARHLCSTGPGITSSSVRSGIFWNGRKMSLLTELVSHLARNSTYMPALTGLRLSGKSGQIRPKLKRQAKIKPKSNQKTISIPHARRPAPSACYCQPLPAFPQKHFKPSSRPRTLKSLANRAKKSPKTLQIC